MNLTYLLRRPTDLFDDDMAAHTDKLKLLVSNSRFLVIGGAGSIGHEVTKALFKRQPRKLHVVDISENNLVELVRDLRSSFGYIKGDFQTFALDVGTPIYDAFIDSDGAYDYVLNFSALKHVRSEKDPYTLMRMLEVNILNTVKTIDQSIAKGVHKYFCISTDKATAPINLMGASKAVLEQILWQKSGEICISSARLANVAFSDGSLLYSFDQRLSKNQPLVAPDDIQRYFITASEAAQLCLLSCFFSKNRDIYFPKTENLKLQTFSDIAIAYLQNYSYQPHFCYNEEDARNLSKTMPSKGYWPLLISKTNTTGEKSIEIFQGPNDDVELHTYKAVAVIKNTMPESDKALQDVITAIKMISLNKTYSKSDIITLFKTVIPDFNYQYTGTYLDSKM